MSEFTCLLGEPALSDFRKNKLTRQLAVEYGLEQALDIRFTYFVEASQALSESGIKRLEDLLHLVGETLRKRERSCLQWTKDFLVLLGFAQSFA